MRSHELAAAQRAEASALAVLHFEQRQVVRARTTLAVAMLNEDTARRAYDAALAARVDLERPGNEP